MLLSTYITPQGDGNNRTKAITKIFAVPFHLHHPARGRKPFVEPDIVAGATIFPLTSPRKGTETLDISSREMPSLRLSTYITPQGDGNFLPHVPWQNPQLAFHLHHPARGRKQKQLVPQMSSRETFHLHHPARGRKLSRRKCCNFSVQE